MRAHKVESELIPLSVFALDHPQPPEGWSNFLGRRGITLRPDHIGRDAISSHDAQMLLHEQRADELRRRKLAAVQEQEAVEQDRVRRASIWKGLPADQLPVGVNPIHCDVAGCEGCSTEEADRVGRGAEQLGDIDLSPASRVG